MRQAFNWTVIFSMLLISLSVAYYFVIFLPGQEEARIKAEVEQKREDERKAKELESNRIQKQFMLNQCLSDAHDDYSDNWNRNCETLGKDPECTLPQENAKRWDQFMKDKKDECYMRYN